jgi:hypothetical protein
MLKYPRSFFIFTTAAITMLLGCDLALPPLAPYDGAAFNETWQDINADPYATLPQHVVTKESFSDGDTDLLARDARRTLTDRADLLPTFSKLVHPNGICMSGTWTINQQTAFTGYFATGASGLIILRASSALSETTTSGLRAFGLAGKIFPTQDPDQVVETANFFAIDDLGGTLAPHFLDTSLINDITQKSQTPLSTDEISSAVGSAFLRGAGTINPTKIRIVQLYPIAELGLAAETPSVSPKWIKIQATSDMPKIDQADLRRELDIQNYPDGIKFEIYVAETGSSTGSKDWIQIGLIHVTDTMASLGCDNRLHFFHARFRD